MTSRRAGAPVVAVVVLAIAVFGLIVWRAWPSPSERRLSDANAERACDAFATRHGGYVGGSGGESVGNAKKLDRAFHLGATAFLAALPKSQGVAECMLTQSDIPACPDRAGSGLLVTQSQVLVSADGSRYVLWCPIIPGA
jgi:hypothetical protein